MGPVCPQLRPPSYSLTLSTGMSQRWVKRQTEFPSLKALLKVCTAQRSETSRVKKLHLKFCFKACWYPGYIWQVVSYQNWSQMLFKCFTYWLLVLLIIVIALKKTYWSIPTGEISELTEYFTEWCMGGGGQSWWIIYFFPSCHCSIIINQKTFKTWTKDVYYSKTRICF